MTDDEVVRNLTGMDDLDFNGWNKADWNGIFAGGAVVGGALLRRGPLNQTSTPSQAHGGVTTAQAGSSRERAQ